MERNRNMTRARSLRIVVPGALLLAIGLPLAARASAVTSKAAVSPELRIPGAVVPAVSNLPAGCASTFELYARPGTVTINTASVPIWGYSTQPSTGTAPAPSLPGPALVACEGPVTVTLHNELAEASAIEFQGQSMIPDTVGALVNGTATYSFTATRGTYLYEAGLTPNQDHQIPMGLYGAFVVVPSTPDGKAYGAVTSTYVDDAVVVMSEIDPALNANPVGFDMRNFSPKFGLVNGQVSPAAPEIAASAPGATLLLRYVNAGVQPHSMALLGLNETVIAYDGSELAHPRATLAETFGPGQTADAIVTIPAAAPPGAKYALYDGSLTLHNSTSPGTGGMLTFIKVTGDLVGNNGPTTAINALTITDLTATITGPVTAAEYFVGTPGTAGAGLPMTLSGQQASASGLSLPPGTPIYVHATDGTTWGPYAIRSIAAADTVAPIVSGITFTPSPTNGAVTVAITATANDAATGGSAITDASYKVDAEATAHALSLNLVSSAVGLSTDIPAATVLALSEGTHVVTVSASDAAGNIGTAPANLLVDKSGPTMSSVAVTPTPNNGTLGVNSSTLAVRVTATATDPSVATVQSPITAAEAFLGTAGGNGSGIVMNPVDGQFNGTSEGLSLDIPLATVKALPAGDNVIRVHAKDAAGNWGAFVTVNLVIDKTGPVVTGLLLTSTPTNGTAMTVTASATDVPGPVTAAELFVDAVGANGTGTATVTSGATSAALTGAVSNTVLAALANGTHTVYVHAKDAAGNWGPTVSITFLLDKTGPTIATMTLSAASVPQGTASVLVSFSGVADNTGGVGIDPRIRWSVDGGTATVIGYSGTSGSVSVPVPATPGAHTVSLQAIDLLGNLGAAKSVTLNVYGDTIFADSFGATLPGNWTSVSTGTAARLNVAAGGVDGLQMLRAQGNNTNYVQYNFGTALNPAATTFDARFLFNPNNNASTGQDILVAASNTTATNVMFRVQYRRNGATPQVRLVTPTVNGPWVAITNNAFNTIEVVRSATNQVTLTVNTIGQAALAGGTAGVSTIRLGSVTSGNSNTLEYFDKFSSKRSVTPLYGA